MKSLLAFVIALALAATAFGFFEMVGRTLARALLKGSC